jgi:hypothetical protein
MKSLVACGLAVLMAGGAVAQRRGGGAVVSGFGTNSGFGNVVFPAGKPTLGTPFTLTNNSFATQLGNAVAGRPFNGSFRRNFNNGAIVYVPYAYPVFAGGYGYGYGDVPPQQQQPNVTVIYPPAQPTPVIINQGQPGGPADVPRSQMQEYMPPQGPAGADQQTTEAPYYLLAFKDHSIYSAVGYWVDGDTLHYITAGNIHNQVSLSLVDRELTEQLNKGRGMQVRLPAAPGK